MLYAYFCDCIVCDLVCISITMGKVILHMAIEAFDLKCDVFGLLGFVLQCSSSSWMICHLSTMYQS